MCFRPKLRGCRYELLGDLLGKGRTEVKEKVSCSVPGLTLLFFDPSQAIRKQQKRISSGTGPHTRVVSVPPTGQ